MARIVKEEEYLQKRNAILDVVQHLVLTKGYEQMSIQDILKELQISKGAFYHYFDAKEALLSAMIERILDEVEHHVRPLVQDSQYSALEKLQHFFSTIVQWKTGQKSLVLAIMRVWYRDENALVRQKLHQTRIQRLAPLLDLILAQGMEEGVFKIDYPDQIGAIFLTLVEDLADTLARHILSETLTFSQSQQLVAAYTNILERSLDLPRNTLEIIDSSLLKAWAEESTVL